MRECQPTDERDISTAVARCLVALQRPQDRSKMINVETVICTLMHLTGIEREVAQEVVHDVWFREVRISDSFYELTKTRCSALDPERVRRICDHITAHLFIRFSHNPEVIKNLRKWLEEWEECPSRPVSLEKEMVEARSGVKFFGSGTLQASVSLNQHYRTLTAA